MDEVTFDELERRLAYVGRAAVGICRVATRNGARVIAEAETAASPVAKHGRRVKGVWVEPGGMRRSIGFSGMKASTGIAGAKAGLDVGKRNPDDSRGSHGHLYVEGTDLRYTGFRRIRIRGKLVDMKLTGNRSNILFRGRSLPHLPSFITTSSASAQTEALNTVIESISAGIARAITRQGL